MKTRKTSPKKSAVKKTITKKIIAKKVQVNDGVRLLKLFLLVCFLLAVCLYFKTCNVQF